MEKKQKKYNFGWSFAWMNGYWIAGVICLSIAIWLLFNVSLFQLIGLILLLVSINLFGGNYVSRKTNSIDYITLPFVDLISSDNDYILDACCGSGRTTLALGKVIRNGRIVALDRFDASYFADGGKQLLEQNIKIAGIQDNVEIVKGDITDLKFEDNTFNAITCTYAIDHIEKQKLGVALKELNRVLKPNGKFLIVLFSPNLFTFLVANLLSFHMTSRKKWRIIFATAKFDLVDEGIINGGAYFLLKKSVID